MTTKAKNTVDAKPPVKSKAATGSLPAKPKPKPIANNKPKSAPIAKVETITNASFKLTNKNPVAKSVETTPTAVKAKKLSKADKPKK